jgi:hypothetical protein
MTKKPPANPVSVEDVAFFADCVRKWQHVLGLHDWRISVADKRSTRRAMAEVYKFDLNQRAASIRVGKDWAGEVVTPENLDKTALHEVLHIFFHEMLDLAARTEDEESIGSAEHRVINVLEVLLPMIPQGEGR